MEKWHRVKRRKGKNAGGNTAGFFVFTRNLVAASEKREHNGCVE